MKADYIFLYKYLLHLGEIQPTPHNITLLKVIFSPLYTHIYVYMYACIPDLTCIETLSHNIAFTHPQGLFQLMEHSNILRLR